DHEQLTVGGAVTKLAAVQNGASPTLAALPMTMAATSGIKSTARFDVRRGRVRVHLRDLRGGRAPRLAPLRHRRQCTRHPAAGGDECCRESIPHSSSKAISMSPIGMLINCFPRLRNVMGLANTRSPPLKCHSSFPVRASRA